MQGRDIGHMKVARDGEELAVDYDFKQNGRGPTIAEKLTLGDDGAPVSYAANGRTTFGNAVSESFRRTKAGVTWRDLAGPGAIKGKDAPRFYVSQNGSPIDQALLAKALLAAPDRTMAVAPAGTARLTEKDRRRLDGTGGPVEVVTYELSGLSIAPSYVTLDSKGEFFAAPSANFIVARAGYEKGADAVLRPLAERLASERLAGLQKEGARNWSGPVRLRNVKLFDPVAKALTPLRDVVWFEGRISEVVPAGSLATPGETVIDGNLGTLVPGLYDMHAHLDQQDGLLNVLAGVTSVRDLGNNNALLTQLIERIERGEVAGPRVTKSGFVEGKSPYSSATGLLAASESEALDHVRWYGARGYNQLKIYNSIDPKWAPPMAKEAHKLGMRVAGHVPAFSSADAMIAAGYDELTHVNQLMLGWVLNPGEDTRTLFRFTAMRRFPTIDLKSEKVRTTLDAMVARKVAHEPTIGIHETGLTAIDGEPNPGAVDYIEHLPVAEQRALKQALFGADTQKERAEYVAAYCKVLDTLSEMHRRGIFLVPGTDTGGAFTLHRELELFTKVGMTPAEALARGTLDVARYLGQDQQLGSIERGKLADFFLIPGDPTRDLRAIKAISMVVKGGTAYFPAEIYPKLGIKPFAPAPKVESAR
ncbi:amidohydrolase [Novosphingobium sp. TH158]|nr:amidohydrolase [Novosphingobium sp. TH158]